MVTIEGRDYADDAPIDWDTAERVGGFYFSRAQWLRMPPPPAVFVADDGGLVLTDAQLTIIGRYHTMMSEAEADAIERTGDAIERLRKYAKTGEI